MALNIPAKLRSNDLLPTKTTHIIAMVFLDFNLGELPYMAATHSDRRLGFMVERRDDKHSYHWPVIARRTSMKKFPGLHNILPREDNDSIWFGEETWAAGEKEQVKMGLSFGPRKPLQSRMFKGKDIPLSGLPRISFGVSQPPATRV
jgi:hypothetical protein